MEGGQLNPDAGLAAGDFYIGKYDGLYYERSRKCMQQVQHHKQRSVHSKREMARQEVNELILSWEPSWMQSPLLEDGPFASSGDKM